MKTETIKIKMSDGKNIALHTWIPDGETKAVVQISHGMAEYAKRYDRFGKILTENGIAMYAHDHRGHGETAETVEELGFLAEKNGFDRVTDDVRESIQKAKADFPNAKIILFGHSFGSFIAQNFIEKYGNEIDACVLCGTAGPEMAKSRFGKFMASLIAGIQGNHKKSNFIHSVAFGSYLKNIKEDSVNAWISRDPEQVKKYDEDPLCGFRCTNRFFADLSGGLVQIHTKKNMTKIPKDLPIFLIAGTADPVGSYGKSVERLFNCYQKLGLTDASMKLYPEARHELLNELNKEDVEKDILIWLSSIMEANNSEE